MKKLLLAVVLAFVSFAAFAGCYSEGVRKGEIQKFSQKGFINKTWEGEMVQEGIRGKGIGSARSLTNIWKFSVTDPAVAKKVDDAMFAGGVVAVKYCQNYIKTKLVADTDYIVTDARAVPN